MSSWISRASLAVLCASTLSSIQAAAQVSPRGSHHGFRPPTLYTPTPSLRPRPEFWLPDAPIAAMALAHGRLYIGGGFSQVAPYTGPFAVVDSRSGGPELAWPRSNGHVNAVIADGAGGWWLGGEFDRVGVVPRSNLAHLFSDGTVDTSTAGVGSEVFALALSGTTLYVGGDFQIAGAADRRMAAAIDTVTGAVLPWRPFLLPMGTSDRILRIVVAGSTVYLAGYYDSPASYPRRHLVAVDATTGNLLPGFFPHPDGMVADLVLVGSTLYTGGNFTQIAGVSRNRLAAIEVTTGTASSLNPGFGSTVYALAVAGTALYVGGAFLDAGGQPRACGAAFSTATGAMLAWNPQAALDDGTGLAIHDLVVSGSNVYACGSFRSIGGQRQYGLARLDPGSGLALAWAGDVGGEGGTEARSVALQGNRLACGGNFGILGGERREGAAALDLVTGQLTPWHPVVHGVLGPLQIGSVTGILVEGNTAWIGGQFSFVNGDPRMALASVDADTGATNLAFAPGFFFNSEFVRAMAKRGGTLYAGGQFHTPIPGQSNMIAFDAVTGAIVPGSTYVGSSITAMVLSTDQSRLYLAGPINEVGNPASPRNGLAALDATTGTPLPWDPAPNQYAREVHYVNERVWVAGGFTSIGGQVHGGLASIDPITGAVEAGFAPIFHRNGSLTTPLSMALYEGTVLAAGDFDVVNGLPRDFMAAIDPRTSFLLDWDPAGTSGVVKILLGEGVLVANGPALLYPTSESRPFLAVYDAR